MAVLANDRYSATLKKERPRRLRQVLDAAILPSTSVTSDRPNLTTNVSAATYVRPRPSSASFFVQPGWRLSTWPWAVMSAGRSPWCRDMGVESLGSHSLFSVGGFGQELPR